jgi:hypothetical protein
MSILDAPKPADYLTFAPGECPKPVPVPKIRRRYRFVTTVPLSDLLDGIEGVGGKRANTLAAPINPLSLVMALETAADSDVSSSLEALGGVPLNAFIKAAATEWASPLLSEVRVRDIGRLVADRSVKFGGEPVTVDLDAIAVQELAGRGTAVVRRADGGRLRLNFQPASARGAAVHVIEDFERFVAEPVVKLADGQCRRLDTTSEELAALAAGQPVVVGRGRNRAILLAAAGAPPSMSTASYAMSAATTGPAPAGPYVVGPTLAPIGGRPAEPPPPRSGPPSGSNVPPPPVTPPVPARAPELALMLPFEQTWELLTYERGELLSSIPLTPQEETTIEVFSWDRKRSSRDDTTSSESEASSDQQSVDRDTRDVFNEMTKGGQFSWGIKGEIQGGVPGYFSASVGGAVNNAQTMNDIARTTRQRVQEETTKASRRVKLSRQTKISESVETGRESRVTRKLRNSNLCHVVIYHYFELLARYETRSRCVVPDIAPVVLVDMPLGPVVFDIDYVRQNETTLRRALVDPAVAAGFEAARSLWMYDRACRELCRECECPGELPAGAADAPSFAAARTAAQALAQTILDLDRQFSTFQWRMLFTALLRPAGNTHGALPVGGLSALYPEVRRQLFFLALGFATPGTWSALVAASRALGPQGTAPGAAALQAFAAALRTIDPALLDKALQPDEALQKHIESFLAARIAEIYQGIARTTVQQRLALGALNIAILDALLPFLSGPITEAYSMTMIVAALSNSVATTPGYKATDDGAVKSLIAQAVEALSTWSKAAAAADTAAADARVRQQAQRQAEFDALFPVGAVLQARERFDALQRHLQARADYYIYAVLGDMLATGRFPTPTVLGTMAPFIDPSPVAVVKGRLAYAIDLSQLPAVKQRLDDIIAKVKDLAVDSDVEHIVLPTPGFHVEPKLSECCACEDFVQDGRALELQQRRAKAKQEELEADRRAKRLSATPPQLEPFDPAATPVQLAVTPSPPVP